MLFRFLPLPPRSVASPPKELRPKEVRSSPMVPIVVNICRRFSLNTRMGLGDSCSLRFVFNRPGSTFTFLTLYEEFCEQFYFKFVQKIRSISFKFPCIFSVVIFQAMIFSNCTVPVRFGDRQSNEIFLLNPGSFPLLVYQLLPHCVSLQVRKVETIVTKCYFER